MSEKEVFVELTPHEMQQADSAFNALGGLLDVLGGELRVGKLPLTVALSRLIAVACTNFLPDGTEDEHASMLESLYRDAVDNLPAARKHTARMIAKAEADKARNQTNPNLN